MSNRPNNTCVLAIYLTTRGFTFALFEGPASPVDWGIKEMRPAEKDVSCLTAIRELITKYSPDVVVIESYDDSLRKPRIRLLYRSVEALMRSARIAVKRYSRAQVRSCVTPRTAGTKYEIAQSTATIVAAFGHLLPPVRKPWVSEDPRFSLFEAAALALTFYCLNGNDIRAA